MVEVRYISVSRTTGVYSRLHIWGVYLHPFGNIKDSPPQCDPHRLWRYLIAFTLSWVILSAFCCILLLCCALRTKFWDIRLKPRTDLAGPDPYEWESNDTNVNEWVKLCNSYNLFDVHQMEPCHWGVVHLPVDVIITAHGSHIYFHRLVISCFTRRLHYGMMWTFCSIAIPVDT